MIANGWPRLSLGEVLTERQETPSVADLASGAIRIVGKIGFNDGQIQFRDGVETKTNMILIRPGDLVVSGINAVKGAIAIYSRKANVPIAATIHYGAYIPAEDRVDVRFLWWLLRSNAFREILLQHLPGGIKMELKAKRLLQVPVPMPSLSEQRRIVARIEELAAKIEEARGLRRKAVEEAEALKGRVVDLLLAKFKSREPLEKCLVEPLMNGLSLPASKMGSGTTFAKVGVVNTGIFNPRETKLVDVHLEPDSPYWLRKGDIVVSRGNTPDLVGRTAVYEGIPPSCAMPDLLIRIRVDSTLADPRFISEYFHSTEARGYIESLVTGTSPTMKKISQPKLRSMPVPAVPLEEQRRIVAYLDDLQTKVDAVKQLQAETSVELEALLPSVLDKAFKGEL